MMMVSLLFILTLTTTKKFIFIYFILMMTWMKFFLNKTSLIMSMLTLEINMLISLFMFLIFFHQFGGVLLMCFITVSVCEAILGLGLLLFISRYKKTEMIFLN